MLFISYSRRQTPFADRLLQAVDDIDLALQRIQWINSHKGIHNVDKLALLLPEPERLLKVLARTRPANRKFSP